MATPASPLNVDDALKNAKGALAHAQSKFPSPAQKANKPIAKAAAGAPAASGVEKEASDINSGLSWKAKQIGDNKDVLGSFKTGGTVPKTGPYRLHKGETVIPADSEGMKTLAASATKKPKIHIEPSDNDGYITKHLGATIEDDKVHVHPSLDKLVDHLKKTYGKPEDASTEDAKDEK